MDRNWKPQKTSHYSVAHFLNFCHCHMVRYVQLCRNHRGFRGGVPFVFWESRNVLTHRKLCVLILTHLVGMMGPQALCPPCKYSYSAGLCSPHVRMHMYVMFHEH